MHDGMQYDPIHCRCDESLKVENPSIFESYLCHLPWDLTAGS